MLHMLLTFVPVAGLLTLTPGATTALAVFFVALFPQFIPRDATVLPCALAMAGVIVALRLAFERR